MQAGVVRLFKLDLHGVRHHEVHDKVDKFIGGHIFEGKTNSVKIVTGNSPEMKSLVKRTLSQYQLDGKEDFFNNGCLIVTFL